MGMVYKKNSWWKSKNSKRVPTPKRYSTKKKHNRHPPAGKKTTPVIDQVWLLTVESEYYGSSTVGIYQSRETAQFEFRTTMHSFDGTPENLLEKREIMSVDVGDMYILCKKWNVNE
jgi:hypothetical protein